MDSEPTKFCIKCLQEKNIDCFGKNKRESDGLHYYCKQCVINIKEANKIDDPDYFKRYAERNREELTKYQKDYRKQKQKEAREAPIDIEALNQRKEDEEERKRKKEEYRERRRIYFRNKYKEDQNYRLKKLFEAKLNRLFRENDNSELTKQLIGCTITEFRSYLESKFLPGMSFETYGVVWNFDRIIPFCDFDLSDPEEAKKCNHFSNIQPLFVQTKVIDGIEFIGNANKNRYKIELAIM